MALSDILQSIKAFFNRLTKKQKALPEGRKSEPRPRTVYATNSTSDWKRSLSVDLQPQKPIVKNNTSEKHILTGSRHQRDEAQISVQNPKFRRRIAAIALSSALVLAPAAAIYKHFHPSFSNMDSQQRIQYIYNREHSEKDLDMVSDVLEETGRRLIKEKIGEAIGLEERQYDDIELTASEPERHIPARVTCPNNTVYYEDNGTLIGAEDHDLLSPGIVSAINSIAHLQDKDNPPTQEELATIAKQIAVLEDNNIHVVSNSNYFENSHRGRTLSADKNIDDLLVHYSINENETENINTNYNQLDNDEER